MKACEWIWAPALIAAGTITAGTLAPDAKADGYLTTDEAAYANAYGASAICPTLDDYPSTSGVLGVTDGIISDGFSADNAVDVLNVAVWEYCPRHWPLLVGVGQAARAGSNPTFQAGGRMGGAI